MRNNATIIRNQQKSLLAKVRLLLVSFVSVFVSLLAACSADGFTYSDFPCFLNFDNFIHQDATLATSMDANVPGTFCLITCDETKHQFHFANNKGLTSPPVPFAGNDMRSHRIGMNGALIVGFGTMSGVFHAYDRECPNCYDPNAVPSKSRPLKMDELGYATCATCKLKYDMNSGGNCVSEGRKKPMTSYRASTTGPFGTLSISN